MAENPESTERNRSVENAGKRATMYLKCRLLKIDLFVYTVHYTHVPVHLDACIIPKIIRPKF